MSVVVDGIVDLNSECLLVFSLTGRMVGLSGTDSAYPYQIAFSQNCSRFCQYLNYFLGYNVYE